MAQELEALVGSDFRAEIGAASSPKALRRFFMRSPRVDALRTAIRQGSITESTLERFAEELMRDFKRGTQFPHEPALAAIAVAIESRQTKFADDFLLDLARLNKIAEMDLAPRVAAICLQERLKTTKVTRRTFESVGTNRIASRGSTRGRFIAVRIVKHSHTLYYRKSIQWVG